jgi:beta-glucosidase
VFTPNAKFTSVDDAYKAVTALLAGTAFNAAQKAAISITGIVHATPGDSTTPVTAYTVTIKGAYPASYDMLLGDLQRSAMRILNIAMQSESFQQLAAQQGVPGIQAGPYTSQFSDLTQYVTVDKSTVKGPNG